jgi:YggT family protein
MVYAGNPIVTLVEILLNLYWWVVMAAVIMSWLTAFNVINMHNNFARSLAHTLYLLTEPVFRPIRRIIPPIGGLDLSPLIVLVLLSWLIYSVVPWAAAHLGLY